MTTSLKSHYQTALKEIGDIAPWMEEGQYFFEHDAYPAVMYMAETREAAIEGYQRALKEFIRERLQNNVADSVLKATSGRGGYRPGSGRPKGSVKEPTCRISVPTRLVDDVRAFIAERSRA